MHGLSEEQILLTLLALAVILAVGRGTAEIARRLRQPEVLGELLGGFLLGPSVLGALLPSAYHTLFLQEGVGLTLSAFSWMGAILLLLIAGLEADLKILREMAKPGALAALSGIVASGIAGTLFAILLLDRPPLKAVFLGLVLSVTAVSVVAKILIEHDSLRRGYAQVILAAGIASEILVWPMVSFLASLRGGQGPIIGLRTILFAILFFAVMMTAGRRFTFWAMRRMADLTHVINGQTSLVLVLTFLSAGVTDALGLHALLGAFVFGVLLNDAPRYTTQLKENIQTLTVGLFAPVFFVLAGMRVDVFQLRSLAAAKTVLLLFFVATVVKVSFGFIGARLGGLRGRESLLVGTGINLKGGSDVIVAILGVTLGLLSPQVYTMYAVVAILTVLVSPPILAWLEKGLRPSQQEMARLNREEAKSRAYLSDIERVLIPVTPPLLPAVSTQVVKGIAQAKQLEEEIFDITELILSAEADGTQELGQQLRQVKANLKQAQDLQKIEVSRVDMSRRSAVLDDPLSTILDTSKDHNLIAIGAKPPEAGTVLTFGELQDRIIDESESDVLVAVGSEESFAAKIERILVPLNGLEYSTSAADVAGYMAKSHGAELVLFTVMHTKMDPLFWESGEHQHLIESGYRILREAKFRLARLDVQVSERVQLGEDPSEEILAELKRQPYQLLVMGAVERSGQDDRLVLSRSIQSVLTQSQTPALMLVAHQ